MDAPEHKSNVMLPLLIGGGAILFFIASKSGGGATVIGQPAASDIIAANENANNNMTQVLLARINTAGSYYDAKVAADQAIKVAQVNGATASELQTLQNQANIAIAKIQGDTAKQLGLDQLQATQDTNQANQQIQKTISNNQTTQAQASAGASKTASWLGAIGNIAGAVLKFFSPGSQTQTVSQFESQPNAWSFVSGPDTPGASTSGLPPGTAAG